MWVKICGNTNLEDAALAAQLGADAVGFVFAASKRQVTPAQVAAITPHLPVTVEKVGVFDSLDPEAIARTAFAAGLTSVQLHGGLDYDLLQQLAEKLAGGVRIVQTLNWLVNQSSPNEAAPHLTAQIKRVSALGIVDRVLIDSQVGAARGGTAVAFDWTAARSVFAAAPSDIRLIVAGGLLPENVAQAIAQLGPWGVDVTSGVEASPGRKDPARVRKFIENAHGAQTP